MHRKPSHDPFRLLFVALALFLVATVAQAGTVNKSIRIASGDVERDDVSSVNGSIRVGDGAEIEGEASTVNGRIDLGDDIRVRGVSSVNGTIDIGRNVSVDGDVTAVNGTIRTEQGTIVDGDVTTVNGTIRLHGTTVNRDVETVNGHITLDLHSIVEGDIVVEDTNHNGWFSRRPKPLEVEILGGSIVKGDVVNLDDEREVLVILRDGSAVEGQLKGARIVD